MGYFGSKYTHTGNRFNVDSSEFKFISLKDLLTYAIEKSGNPDIVPRFKLLGLYVSDKGNFGDQPVLIIDGYKVNCPKHLTEIVREIIKDDEAVAAINAGLAGFDVYTYTKENDNRVYYSVNFVDYED